MTTTRRNVLLFAAAFAWTVGTATADTAPANGKREEVAPGLFVGDVLDSSNWKLAEGLLPPEILDHYRHGHYRNPIVSYPTGRARWEQSFLEATERNATRLDVDERGGIVDRETGKQPDYYYGIPFPHVDPDDPKAGVKIVWNQFLAYWYGGSSFNQTLVSMVRPNGLDREVVADGWFKFYDGQTPKYREDNPLALQSQFLGVSTRPADLQGTASLTWRYRDPGKRDSVWAYVPAIRRVRAVSPANRSDGYLGSDISGDDGFFFDGKPEDFEWKLVGKRDALRIVDPESVSKPVEIRPAPKGGWIVLTDRDPPTVGYRLPGWKGVAWAPTDAGLAKRPMWIVEGKPRDPYYLYGRIELWIDAETWDGAWNRKFSWSGELVNTYQLMARVNHAAGPPEEREWLPASTQVWACAENFKMNRATLGGMRAWPGAAFYRRIHAPPELFDPNTLSQLGK
ncbi:MAG: hypothetical protein KatS3mg076_2614 [Candidatus Binatia bacterium]|nr:MAG: hypothetical protein KatS3mg076_2614 [Candidatus Binatia bacterium]